MIDLSPEINEKSKLSNFCERQHYVIQYWKIYKTCNIQNMFLLMEFESDYLISELDHISIWNSKERHAKIKGFQNKCFAFIACIQITRLCCAKINQIVLQRLSFMKQKF